MDSYICGSSNFHPYECSHDKFCEHCTWAKTDWHNPKECALCQDLGFQIVKEPFAVRIDVWDLTPRKQRIKLNKFIDTIANKVSQQELPF